MKEVRVSSFAKVNLGLEITARRADGFHELVSVMQTVSLADTLIFDPADATQDDTGPDGLLSLFDNQLENGFQIVFPISGVIWRFAGLVSAYEPGAPFDEALTASVTVKVTGQPTFAAV